MENTLTFRGAAGELRVGGRVAATLTDWSLVGNEHVGWTCTAAVHDPAPYLTEDRQPELRLVLGDKTFRWKPTGDQPVTLSLAGPRATITAFGAPEALL